MSENTMGCGPAFRYLLIWVHHLGHPSSRSATGAGAGACAPSPQSMGSRRADGKQGGSELRDLVRRLWRQRPRSRGTGVVGCSAPGLPRKQLPPHSAHRQLGLLERRPRGGQDRAQAEGRPGRGSAGAGLLGSGSSRPVLGVGLGGHQLWAWFQVRATCPPAGGGVAPLPLLGLEGGQSAGLSPTHPPRTPPNTHTLKPQACLEDGPVRDP